MAALNKRWELKEGQVRRIRDKRQRMTKDVFLQLAEVDLIAARAAAVSMNVPLEQIQLWELAIV